MLNNKTIAVVVPAYNEEKQIGIVIETMPDFVDRIIIVNDRSSDKTEEVVKSFWNSNQNKGNTIHDITELTIEGRFEMATLALQNQMKLELNYFPPSQVANSNPDSDRIILINQKNHCGVGTAVARGYKWCKDHGIDCVAKMDGDGQMDPDKLLNICLPVIDEGIDYVKGNRLIHGSALLVIPKTRYIGNSILSILTKIASGYWAVSDTQTAFTAISNKALNSISIHKLYHTYGYPNDILVKLNIASCTLKEVEMKPIYEIGEKSKMKIWKIVMPIAWLLFKSFFKRLWLKYFFRDFHPLFILYNMSFVLFILSIPFAIRILSYLMGNTTGERPILNSIMFMFLIVSAFQSVLFAMWMDIQDNERLYK